MVVVDSLLVLIYSHRLKRRRDKNCQETNKVNKRVNRRGKGSDETAGNTTKLVSLYANSDWACLV